MTPRSVPVGFQRWRSLLFAHWPVPPACVARLVPSPLTVDTFAGSAYVGVVPFAMTEVRPWRRLPPVPTAAAFLEANVRTYVSLDGRAGVWFFSLDAASTLAVLGARAGFGLPYHRARMSFSCEAGSVRYRTRRLWPGPRPATLDCRYTIGARLEGARPGSLEHFLVERYTLFAARANRCLIRGEVRHRPYPLRQVTVDALDETLLAAAGIDAGERGPRPPDLYSDGVDVDIFAPRRVGR
jgi:uncharacterized protein YqjF (DUF2071 family)